MADKQETYLVNDIQDLMLESKPNTQNSTDIPVPPLDVPDMKCEGEDRTNEPMTTPTYEMTYQEIQLQQEKEKFGIYMHTFCYEGDNSNLDSEMDSDSNVMAYPYLE